MRTLAAGLHDACAPGEVTPLATRLKALAQAVVGVGLGGRLRRAKKRPQHLHAHFAHAPATLAMYAALQLDVSFSFTGHANDLFERRGLLKRKLERASFVACISEWHRGFYSAVLHRDTKADPLVAFPVVRCGVDTTEFEAAEPRRPTGRPPAPRHHLPTRRKEGHRHPRRSAQAAGQ